MKKNIKKYQWQDNFIKKWTCSSHNHPDGWKWWKRYNRRITRKRLKEEMERDIIDSNREISDIK